MWKPTATDLTAPANQEQESAPVPVTFLDGTNAQGSGSLASLVPHYKGQVTYASPMRFDPNDPDQSTLY